MKTDELTELLKTLNETEIKALELIVNKGTKKYLQIANELGVDERHLRRIRRKPEFKRALHLRTMENLGEHTSGVMDALVMTAKKGNVKAIELFAKIQGLLVERSEVKQTVTEDRSNDAIENDIADLREIVNDINGKKDMYN